MSQGHPKLILHIGHGKTGSSMLQSVFAKNVPALAAEGILYPGFRNLAAAAQGRITSGNLDAQEPNLQLRYEQALANGASPKAVLFSNEHMYESYGLVRNDVDQLRLRGTEVEIVLFVRDPLDHAASGYAQRLKRRGATYDFAEMLETFDFPEHVAAFIRQRRDEGIRLHVANYSRHSKDLVRTFFDFLAVDSSKLIPPPVKTVNRSLTGSELFLMRRLNGHFDLKTTWAIGDALCERLPDLPSAHPYLSKPSYDAFLSRITPIIEKANALLPQEEHYRVSDYESYASRGMLHPDDPLTFTPVQIELILDQLTRATAGTAAQGERGIVRTFLKRVFGG